jgi:hypothetical protein
LAKIDQATTVRTKGAIGIILPVRRLAALRAFDFSLHSLNSVKINYHGAKKTGNREELIKQIKEQDSSQKWNPVQSVE